MKILSKCKQITITQQEIYWNICIMKIIIKLISLEN